MVTGFQFEPEALYDDGPLVVGLGMSGTAVAKARRSGALRYTRRGGRILYFGHWITAWLAGEDTPPKATPAAEMPVKSSDANPSRGSMTGRRPVGSTPDKAKDPTSRSVGPPAISGWFCGAANAQDLNHPLVAEHREMIGAFQNTR